MPWAVNRPMASVSTASLSTLATTVATLWACCLARLTARSSATFDTSRQSGMMKATTTAEVVAATAR